MRLIYANQRKEEGKDQESIQSSVTHDPGHRMGKSQIHKKTSHTGEAVTHSHDSMAKKDTKIKKKDPQKKYRL